MTDMIINILMMERSGHYTAAAAAAAAKNNRIYSKNHRDISVAGIQNNRIMR
jgi:hypothetical protein